MKSKLEFMQDVFAGLAEETLVFVPDDGGPSRVYNVTELRRRLYAPGYIPHVDGELVCAYMEDVAPFLMARRVWDPSRLASLTDDDLRDPPIALSQPDGTMVVVDGTHRAIRLHQLGASTIDIMVVPDHLAPRAQPGPLTVTREDWGESLASLHARTRP